MCNKQKKKSEQNNIIQIFYIFLQNDSVIALAYQNKIYDIS